MGEEGRKEGGRAFKEGGSNGDPVFVLKCLLVSWIPQATLGEEGAQNAVR